MDFRTMKRNVKRIHDAIDYDSENSVMRATEEFSILFPSHWLNGKLGYVDGIYRVTGLLTYVVGNSYAVSLVPSMMPLTPTSTTEVKIGKLNYMVLSWEDGDVICPNTSLPSSKSLLYEIYNEIIAKGKQPAYFNYSNRANLLYSSKRFADVDLGGSQPLEAIFAANCIRSADDMTMALRETFETQEDYDNKEGVVIPFQNVSYGTTNATSRVLGSRLGQAMVTELVSDNDTNESIEDLLRT